MEFTLNQVDIYEICEKTHATSSCKLPTRIKNNLKKPTIEEEELNYVGHRSQNIGYNAHQGQYGSRPNWNQNPWKNANQWIPPYQPQPPPTFWGQKEWTNPQFNQPQWQPSQPQ